MKKNTQVILLSLGLLLLIAVAINAFKTMQGVAPPPAAPAAPAAAAGKGTPETKAAGVQILDWVQDNEWRIASLAKEVEGGRNPFRDLRLSATSAGTSSSTAGTPSDTPGATLPGGFPTESPVTASRALAWTTLAAVKDACRAQNLPIEIEESKKAPDTIALTGYASDIEQAMGIIAALDVPPPVPNFALLGTAVKEKQRFAALLLDGKYYAMLEGETVPTTGWLVKKVAPTGVTLTKGKQSVQLSFSGGMPQ